VAAAVTASGSRSRDRARRRSSAASRRPARASRRSSNSSPRRRPTSPASRNRCLFRSAGVPPACGPEARGPIGNRRMTKIAEVIAVAGRAGFFNRDLAAVKGGAKADGFAYPGKPVSPGFTRILQPGTAISAMLLLEDGQVAFGDCMDVILSGVAGRDPLFRAEDHLDFLRTTMRGRLRGRAIDEFRPLAEEIDRFEHNGK